MGSDVIVASEPARTKVLIVKSYPLKGKTWRIREDRRDG